VKPPLLNAFWSSEPAEAPGRDEDGNSKEARAREPGGRTDSARVDEMIEALLEAVREPGEEPNETAVDPGRSRTAVDSGPTRIDDPVEGSRRTEPAADSAGRELAVFVVALVALGLIAIAVGIAVGILSGRLSLQ
jgi:hypothetical protein